MRSLQTQRFMKNLLIVLLGMLFTSCRESVEYTKMVENNSDEIVYVLVKDQGNENDSVWVSLPVDKQFEVYTDFVEGSWEDFQNCDYDNKRVWIYNNAGTVHFEITNSPNWIREEDYKDGRKTNHLQCIYKVQTGVME